MSKKPPEVQKPDTKTRLWDSSASPVRDRIFRGANILVIGAAVGLSSCIGDIMGDPADAPVCSELNSNEDALYWVSSLCDWENDDKERVILNVSLPYEKLHVTGDPVATGATVESTVTDDNNQYQMVLIPDEGATLIDVLLALDCKGRGFHLLVRVDLTTPSEEGDLRIPSEVIDPDAVEIGDAGPEDSQ